MNAHRLRPEDDVQGSVRRLDSRPADVPAGERPQRPLAHSHLIELQRLAGNGAVSALLTKADRGRGAEPVTAGRSTAGKDVEEDEVVAGRSAGVQRGLFDWFTNWGTSRVSQPVSITTVSGPKDLGRGGFDWKVWFNLSAAAGNSGWIIQEVDVTKPKVSWHFWEAWEVEKGKKVTIWHDKGLDDNDDRYYTSNAPAKSKGTITARGRVKFYEGALPPDFKKNNPSTPAGVLHSTTAKPPFWDGSGTVHDITSEWDDTVSPTATKVEADAGGVKLIGK